MGTVVVEVLEAPDVTPLVLTRGAELLCTVTPKGSGVPKGKRRAAALFQKACEGGVGEFGPHGFRGRRPRATGQHTPAPPAGEHSLFPIPFTPVGVAMAFSPPRGLLWMISS